jgi:hypothetical protein
MAFKMKHSSPFNNNGKAKRMTEEESMSTGTPDMEVEITAKNVTKSAGQSLPGSDISKGRKVFERPSKRTFGDVSLTKEEKLGAKGKKYAKTRTASVQTVKIK